jgi:hypothetical protein
MEEREGQINGEEKRKRKKSGAKAEEEGMEVKVKEGVSGMTRASGKDRRGTSSASVCDVGRIGERKKGE